MQKISELNMKNEKICPDRQTKQNQNEITKYFKGKIEDVKDTLIKLYQRQENIKLEKIVEESK